MMITVSIPARRARPWLRAIVSRLCLFLLCVAGAALTVTLFGTRTYHWQAFDVQVGIAPAMHGQTRLIFTPLGEVRAATHRTPLALKVSLQGISFEKMKALIVKPPPRAALERDFARKARRSLNGFSAHQIALGALGGLIAPLLLRVRRLRVCLCCALIGSGFVGAALFLTVRTFDRRAFQNPTYTGSLREAGMVIGLAKDAFLEAEALGDKLRNVATNLGTLYGRINAVPPLAASGDTVRILHVSDIHNNAAAVDFLRELAEKFRVDGIIDTGDLTDYGTPLETRLSSGLARLSVPYLFVAGNHDSQATVRAVRANRNALILNGQPATVAGLRVLGAPDPSSARPGLGNVNTPPEALRAAGERLYAEARREPLMPDILCVHNPRQAELLLGQAPLILCGHRHHASIDACGVTVVCNAGTTGGAGLRYLDLKEGVALSAAILTFTRPPRPRLLFIDLVVLDGSLNQYSISRHTFNAITGSSNLLRSRLLHDVASRR